jgi:ribonuclease/clavin/mitogillin
MTKVTPVTIVNVGYRHCVSLLLDDGSVFTGDLPPEAYAFDNPIALATWRLLRERGATRVYPAHGPARSIDETLDKQPPDKGR